MHDSIIQDAEIEQIAEALEKAAETIRQEDANVLHIAKSLGRDLGQWAAAKEKGAKQAELAEGSARIAIKNMRIDAGCENPRSFRAYAKTSSGE